MYEISNYAPPGHEARHNLSYWRLESYLGLGAGAHSFARAGTGVGGGRRWWNERMPGRYVEQALEGGLAEAGGETVDSTVERGEFVFLNLRLRAGFALADFEERFGESFDRVFGARAARLFEGELLVRDEGRIYLSERGLELADWCSRSSVFRAANSEVFERHTTRYFAFGSFRFFQEPLSERAHLSFDTIVVSAAKSSRAPDLRSRDKKGKNLTWLVVMPAAKFVDRLFDLFGASAWIVHEPVAKFLAPMLLDPSPEHITLLARLDKVAIEIERAFDKRARHLFGRRIIGDLWVVIYDVLPDRDPYPESPARRPDSSSGRTEGWNRNAGRFGFAARELERRVALSFSFAALHARNASRYSSVYCGIDSRNNLRARRSRESRKYLST